MGKEDQERKIRMQGNGRTRL